MSLLNPCVRQVDEYSFIVEDATTDQAYDAAGVDLSTVTAAKIVFKDLYTNETYDIDIIANWSYLLGDGLTINIADFPDYQMGDYEYFPDYMYHVSVVYTYGGREYTAGRYVGFREKISKIVYQQLQQSDWVKELKCGCGCEKYSTTFRKFNYLQGLQIAAKNCLINQYNEILLALYKLTGTVHEYA